MKRYLFLLLLAIGSCVALKPLKMQRVDNLTNRIRTDGIYLSHETRSSRDFSEITVLYNNGTFLHLERRIETDDDIKSWREYFQKNNYHYETPYCWGIYQLQHDSILFESWLSADYYYPTYSYSGGVLNDSTITIKESTTTDTFRFVEFSPKPDSTNKFIK